MAQKGRQFRRREALKNAVKDWIAWAPYSALAWRQGPGFLEVIDNRRPDAPARRYVLDETTAAIYLACDAGATAIDVHRHLAPAVSIGLDEVQSTLDELMVPHLLYVEDGRYLSLSPFPRIPGGKPSEI